jgi:hypothetical protein
MRRFLFLSLNILFACTAFSQVLTRDPKHNREESNTEWKGQYTLYDYWNDEPILPDENGIYRLYYDLKPVFVVTSSQIHEVFAIDQPDVFRGNAAELAMLGSFCKFKNYDSWDMWRKGYTPHSPIPDFAQQYVPKVTYNFNSNIQSFTYGLFQTNKEKVILSHSTLTFYNDGSNDLVYRNYKGYRELISEYHGKWRIFEMANHKSIEVIAYQNGKTSYADIYDLEMNPQGYPNKLTDIFGQQWNPCDNQSDNHKYISTESQKEKERIEREYAEKMREENESQGNNQIKSAPSQIGANQKEITEKKNDTPMKFSSIGKIDVSPLAGTTYKLYLQPGKKSSIFEWENPNPATPHPTKPIDFLPKGQDYFEVNIGVFVQLIESSDFFYQISKQISPNYNEIPESERYRIEISTNSNLLTNGKFRVIINYDYPPKSKFRTNILYVYCDELKNDLMMLGIN